MGTLEEGWGFPCFILVLFHALKYIEVWLFLFCLCLIGVLRVARVTTTSLSRVSGDTCLFYPFFLSFSPFLCFCWFCFLLFCFGFFLLCFGFLPHCLFLSFLPFSPLLLFPLTIRRLRSYVRAFISSSVVMFQKISHVMGIVKVWRASSTNNLINPW